MGRLNYTNVLLQERKIDGVKLGQVVAKDLTKRIPPALGSKAALRDPVVEIDVRSKLLTDAGFSELSEGLMKSLHHNEQDKIVLLEEVCLKANRLTVASLENLTPIIELVGNDLRDLDLSDNLISVNDPDDVIPWEAFLMSLSQCCVLRRLDLSGNELGYKAFEVLARVYAREEPLDLVLPKGLGRSRERTMADCAATLEHININSKIAESDDIRSIEDRKSKPKFKPRKDKVPRHGPKSHEKGTGSPDKHDQPLHRLEQLHLYSTTRGLHSIPYIVLTDTCLNDAGALYLSYVLVEHHAPNHLLPWVPPAKAGPEQQQLDSYDDTQCRGIIYVSNTSMTKKGTRVLGFAEEERLKLTEYTASSTSNNDLNGPVKISSMDERSGGLSLLCDYPRGRTHRRRTSISASGHSGSNGTTPKPMSDLNSARSRIQGEELERTGQYGNDLWRVSMNMLCLCREIQRPKPQEVEEVQEVQRAPPPPVQPVQVSSLEEDFPALRPVASLIPKKPIVKTLDVPGFPLKKSKAAPLLPLSNGNPNQAMLPRSRHLRKASVATALDSASMSTSISGALTKLDQIDKAQARSESKEYRSRLPCGFSEEIWRRILGQAVGANGILSARQQESILAWAMDRNTLKKEREWLVEKEGNQIWHVLEGMSCLAYEFDYQNS